MRQLYVSLVVAHQANRRIILIGALLCLVCSCSNRKEGPAKSIKITRVPQADRGGRQRNEIIEGVAEGAGSGERIVLYAREGKWWVQPLANRPFTPIVAGSRWTNSTHLGTEYAALLVNSEFSPPFSTDELPALGGNVLAIANVKGASSSPSRYLRFSGYDWRVRATPSARGGNTNQYDTKNSWTDGDGALHLKISKWSGGWNCAELSLARSLGYGTYSFLVRDTSHMQPSAALDLFTYDYAAADENYHEMAIEISQWGDTESKNSQYVVQPYYEAANVTRFAAPPGTLQYSLRWERGRATFRTVLRPARTGPTRLISEKAFTLGIPEPGIESIRIAFYAFHRGKVPLQSDAEIVIDKFEYVP